MAKPGAIVSTAISFRYAVRCGECSIPAVRDLGREQRIEVVLAAAGWKRTGGRKGWVCQACAALLPVRRRKGLAAKPPLVARDRTGDPVRDPVRGKILAMLRAGAKWSPALLARELGISRQRVYVLHKQFVRDGLIEKRTRVYAREG